MNELTGKVLWIEKTSIHDGEVLMQSEFAAAILKESMLEGMNTAIETSLYGDYETKIRPLLPFLSTMYVDFMRIEWKKNCKVSKTSYKSERY